MAEEFTDEQVMTPVAGGLTDEQVMTSPPVQPSGRQGGLAQTIPQFVETVGSSEGREKLRHAIQTFGSGPGDPHSFIGGMLEYFKGAGKSLKGEMSLEDEVEFGLNTALGMIGGKSSIPHADMGAVKALTPIMKEFNETVLAPAIGRLLPEIQITPVNGSDVPKNVPRSDLAATGEPHVDAVTNSEVTKQTVDHPIVDRTHEVPYTAGGSVPLEDPTVFIDRRFPKSFTIDGVTFDPAEPFTIHENVEQHTMDLLIKGGMTPEEAYRVAHFEYAEKAEGAWYREHGIDQAAAEAAYAPYMAEIQKAPATDIPSNLYSRPYPHDEPSAARGEAIAEARPSAAEIAQAKDIIAKAQESGELQPAGIEPEPVHPFQALIQEASDLGIIGPDKLPVEGDSPAQAAQRAISARRTGDDKITMTPAGEPIDSYQQRFKEWVSKIKHPGDVDNLIARAAEENNYFPEARAGEIPAAHVDELGKASGFDGSKFDRAALRKRFTSDDEIRAVEQVLLQTRDDLKAALDKVRSDPSEANVTAAAEAKQRHEYALEYVAAFRSDWGKAGLAQQEFLRRDRLRQDYDMREGHGVPKEANDLVSAIEEFGHAPSKKGLQGLIDAAEKAVDAAAPAAEGAAPKEPMPSGLAELIGGAKDVLRRLKTGDKRTGLDRLIAAAEKTAGPQKQAVQRAAAQQMPPELQALIDKAERVTDRFGGIERKRAEAQAIAEATKGIEPEGISYVVSRAWEMAVRAGKWVPDWLYWLRNNWLLSGPITHSFYFAVNTGTALAEHVVTPTIAATLNKLVGGRDVLAGESFAALLGFGHAVPGAIKAAMEAARTGLRVPLESELRLAERGEVSPQSKGASIPYLAHSSPDWGLIKSAADWLGVPMVARTAGELAVGGWAGRFANLQHTFFKVLNEGAMAHRNAYVATAKEGLDPLRSSNFIDRYQYHLRNPTDEVLRDNVNAGYAGTFMEKLGPVVQRLTSALKDTPLRWEFPFLHVPVNIARAGIRMTPLAIFGPEMRAELLGQRGARPQALALARVVGGTAVLSYIMNQALQGRVTGDYPLDPKERKRWGELGIQPNSVQIGEEWVSFNRFGPARIPMSVGANIGQIARNYNGQDDKSVAKLIGEGLSATVHSMGDEVGMLALAQLFQAMEGDRTAAQFGAGEVASFAPYNVGAAQLASFNDPSLRQVKSITDGLKYRVPFLRETLPAKRDPLYGEPVPNPAYHTLIRTAPVNRDWVKEELERLDYWPTAPQSHIKGVKLTPEQYDRYQATAGPLVKSALSALVQSEGWYDRPEAYRKEHMQAAIKMARARARDALMVDQPQLIEAARQAHLKSKGLVPPDE